MSADSAAQSWLRIVLRPRLSLIQLPAHRHVAGRLRQPLRRHRSLQPPRANLVRLTAMLADWTRWSWPADNANSRLAACPLQGLHPLTLSASASFQDPPVWNEQQPCHRCGETHPLRLYKRVQTQQDGHGVLCYACQQELRLEAKPRRPCASFPLFCCP